MRSIWSGSIAFGLVNIPIKLYSATQEHEISFDMLHKKDLSPIRFARVCKEEEKEIEWKDIVKGYEYQPGEYVVITDEDFQDIQDKNNKAIEIQEFVDEKSIPSIYFDKPYYLEPGKGAQNAYILLRDALKKSKKVGISTYTLRNKKHIGIVKALGDLLVLVQMRFHSELREAKNLELPDAKVKTGKELDMAVKLIDQMTTPFKAEKFKDTYREDLKKVIDQKLKGKKPKAKAKAAKPSKVTDIMSLLKASLNDKNHHYKKTG